MFFSFRVGGGLFLVGISRLMGLGFVYLGFRLDGESV